MSLPLSCSYHKAPVSLLLAFVSSLLLACDSGSGSAGSSKLSDKRADKSVQVSAAAQSASLLEQIRQRGKLIVLTVNLPTTYYFDRDNQLAGPEYDMSQAFAGALGIDVEYRLYDSTRGILQALRNKKGDIAAAGLTVNDVREQEFDFGPSYQEVEEYLVCHRKSRDIYSREELKGLELVIAAQSNYLETMKQYPQASWVVDGELNTSKLLAEVAARTIQCTVSDSNLFAIERRYHTELQKKFILADHSELAWALPAGSPQLKQAIAQWLESYQADGELAAVMERYYGYVEVFDYVDTHKFLRRIKTRLPKYKQYFIDAAKQNGIDPALLAAQSYQESHWDRKAKSPTGVRGIMMLTQPVAKSLGVTNRLHAKQNIFAGAKFHAKMKKMVEHVPEPDRSWLALAAYNVGRGHFRDAQSLARRLGKNPDRWHEMKTVLPLLAEKEYYSSLRYGYARGNEPVRYVERIRSYYDHLKPHFSTAALSEISTQATSK